MNQLKRHISYILRVKFICYIDFVRNLSLIYRKTGNAIELESAGFAGGMFVAKDAAAGGKRGI